MADMYAWSDILSDKGKFARGSKVTKASLGASDEDWDAMVRGGSIRPRKFPAPEDYEGSALDYIRDQLREVQQSSLEEAEGQISLAEIAASEPS